MIRGYDVTLSVINDASRKLVAVKDVPERVTTAELTAAILALSSAHSAIKELLYQPLPGCKCRRVEDGDRSHVDYDETCQHHASLHARAEALEKSYDKARKNLELPFRVQLMAAILPFANGSTPEEDAEDALRYVDAALAALTR